MLHYHVPGISIAIIEDYKISDYEVYGVKNSETKDKVTKETIFLAGSISKAVTALGALKLVEQGLLSLDDNINDHLVSWKIPSNGAFQPKITLRQLLSHTA